MRTNSLFKINILEHIVSKFYPFSFLAQFYEENKEYCFLCFGWLCFILFCRVYLLGEGLNLCNMLYDELIKFVEIIPSLFRGRI